MDLGIAITISAGYLVAIWYIAQSLGKRIDDVVGEVRAFRAESHVDMQTHTEAITILRERMAKLDGGG